MVIKKSNWILIAILAGFACVGGVWTLYHQTDLFHGLKNATSNSDAKVERPSTALTGAPNGIVQEAASAAIQLPGFSVQVQKIDSIRLPIPKVVEVIKVIEPMQSRPVVRKQTVVATNKTVSVKPATRIV